MPRILVADDNSNIHRTVALALKEAGVEVVAVGNGEAAVRKIAEIKPDLVLADIFMPVRSGYEVCEFVKQDPRFAEIPVVLLIGAFDPFDEREAQRVHADGILKKPFVPPDSLLRMVADLLAQSASRTAAVPVAAAVAKAERPAPSVAPAPAPSPKPAEYAENELLEELVPSKAQLEWNTNEQPIAFGTLLETPSAEIEAAIGRQSDSAETDDAVMTSRRDPTLGEPAFWARKPQAEPEQSSEEDAVEVEAEIPSALGDEDQWRSGAGLDLGPEPLPAIVEIAAPASLVAEEKEIAPELPDFSAPVAQFSAVSPLTTTLEDSSLPELPQLPELPSPDLPAVQSLASLPALDSFPAKSTFEPAVPETKSTPEPEKELVPDLKDFPWAAARSSEKPAVATDEAVPADEAVNEVADDAENEIVKAAAPGLATLAPFLASLTSSASAREAKASDDFDFDSLPSFPGDLQAREEAPESIEPLDATPTPQLDQAIIEAVAQRVIERMQPGIIELVTRELLRPAVEALVQRELEKK